MSLFYSVETSKKDLPILIFLFFFKKRRKRRSFCFFSKTCETQSKFEQRTPLIKDILIFLAISEDKAGCMWWNRKGKAAQVWEKKVSEGDEDREGKRLKKLQFFLLFSKKNETWRLQLISVFLDFMQLSFTERRT